MTLSGTFKAPGPEIPPGVRAFLRYVRQSGEEKEVK